MSIASGYLKYKRHIKQSDGTYKLVSHWTSSNTVHMDNGNTLETEVEQINSDMEDLKKSASDGKSSIASAITNNGVTTAADATFATMAANISTLATNKYNAGVTATKKGTAVAANVLTGKTFTNSSGVGLSGTMTNQGAKTASLNCGDSYAIPAGYHNGSGKVTANSLASQTSATATAMDIMEGKTAYVNGVEITGTNKSVVLDEKNWMPGDIIGNIEAVYANNGLWVASVSGKGIWYSTNGVNWTQSNVTSGTYGSFCYDNGLWVACSGGNGVAITSTNDGIWYSTDGKTWTQSNITDLGFMDVQHYNGTWVAITGVQNNLSYDMYYSTDGKTWTWNFEVSTAESIFCIYCYNGIWVIGTSRGLWYSTDGKTWTQSNITSDEIGPVYCYNGQWIATGDSYLYYSTDGKTWTTDTYRPFNKYYCYNGLWVAHTYSSNGYAEGLFYSTDGKTWTQSNINDAISMISNFQIHCYNGIWVMGGENFNGKSYSGLWYSTDGKTWTQSKTPNDNSISNINSLYVYNGTWVAGTSSAILYTHASVPS